MILKKFLPIDFLLSVYDSLFISLQAGQMDFILKTKSWLILNVENESFFLIFYCYSITVVCLFSPSLHPTPSKPASLPHLHPPPWFCPCVLYSSSCNPLSSLSPTHSPLSIVRLFLTSMCLVIFCLLFFFYLLCSSYRWDHMVFVPHRLVYFT